MVKEKKDIFSEMFGIGSLMLLVNLVLFVFSVGLDLIWKIMLVDVLIIFFGNGIDVNGRFIFIGGFEIFLYVFGFLLDGDGYCWSRFLCWIVNLCLLLVFSEGEIDDSNGSLVFGL